MTKLALKKSRQFYIATPVITDPLLSTCSRRSTLISKDAERPATGCSSIP